MSNYKMIAVDPETHMKLRVLATVYDKPIKNLVTEGVEMMEKKLNNESDNYRMISDLISNDSIAESATKNLVNIRKENSAMKAFLASIPADAEIDETIIPETNKTYKSIVEFTKEG